VILLGADRPGIVASVSDILGRYRANIETVQSVAREGMFLMELLTDVSQCRIPLENLMANIENTMRDLGMQTRFQAQDVFNKKKRAVLLDVRHSFMDSATAREIVVQAGLDPARVRETFDTADPTSCLQRAGALIHRLPASVLSTISAGVTPTRGTTELVQTLKTMGYRVALATTALSGVVEPWAKELGLDHCFAVPTRIDDDEQTVDGELTAEDCAASSVDSAIRVVATAEQMDGNDITVIGDVAADAPVGIRLEFDLAQLLHLRNERVLSSDQLLGLLGCFGLPRAAT
jgi:predicted amino acid-binding ACT domain protein/phosphoserine phosphatase